MTDPTLSKLFAHMDWADRRVLRLLTGSEGARTPAAMRLFSHVLAAERVWLLRMRGEDSAVQPIWPELDLDDLTALAEGNREGYAAYLAMVDDAELAREVAYTSSQGAPFRTRVADILLQVATHGAYHRGQIAAEVRGAAAEPVSTDYILFVRDGARLAE